MMAQAYFAVCAVVAVAGALGLLFSRNVLHGALCLVTVMLALAALFAQLMAPFVAVLQVIVYAGAIVVLFLFVIMLLSLRGERGLVSFRKRFAAALGVLIGAVVAVELAALVAPRTFIGPLEPVAFGTPEAVGSVIFGTYLYPFEVASVLLLAAMVGAIVMARSPKKEAEEEF
jgi:NADH-quinone oxidoreductase subunit J